MDSDELMILITIHTLHI